MKGKDFRIGYAVTVLSTALSFSALAFMDGTAGAVLAFAGNGIVCAAVGYGYLAAVRRYWKTADPGAYAHSFSPWGGRWKLWADPAYAYSAEARELLAGWRRLGAMQAVSMAAVFFAAIVRDIGG